VAANLTKLVPVHDVACILRLAVLQEFAHGQALDRSIAEHDEHDPSERYRNDGTTRPWEECGYYGFVSRTTRMLDWLIRHDPRHCRPDNRGDHRGGRARARHPPRGSERSIRNALDLESTLDDDIRSEFLERVVSPEAAGA
jgi:hypothetical protein